MANKERKNLVWSIKQSLLSLSPGKLFQIVDQIGPLPSRDTSELSSEDAEGCFEHINAFMYSKNLIESEDMGMGELLALKDVIDGLVQSNSDVILPVDTSVSAEPVSNPVTSPSAELAQAATVSPLATTTVSEPAATTAAEANTLSNANVVPDNVQQMLLNYEDLSKKLLQYANITLQTTAQPTPAQPTSPNIAPSHSSTRSDGTSHHASEQVVSLKDLSFIQRREFKVQGGQIGDHSSDISYNSVCRQIEEGVKDNFTDTEIVRGVLRIIKPGDFKDMLVNKEDMTVAELKRFLQSHLGERNSTELFQELICAKQKEHETAQQFLYRVIGLKQRILFLSKQSEAEMKYNPDTVQGVFLHTVYQGIGHKHNDIRRELKPLLSDHTVADETILKQVMKITSDESERQRRLGSALRPKQTSAHSAQVEAEHIKQPNAKKETVEQKNKTDIVQQLSDKVEMLTKLVESLAEAVQKNQVCNYSSAKPQMDRKERPYGCPKCLEKGLQDCRHCFICGGEGHRAIGCLKRPQRQGNASRLLQRDKQ